MLNKILHGSEPRSSKPDLKLHNLHTDTYFAIFIASVQGILLFSSSKSVFQHVMERFGKESEIQEMRKIDTFMEFTVDDDDDQMQLHNFLKIDYLLAHFKFRDGT